MSARIYIGRLSNWARDRDIERFLKGFGRVKDISIKNGYCFVDFEDHRDADDAVYELNGRELCGDRVIVEHARGTPRGEDMRRDLDRGFMPSSRSGRSGGGGGSRGMDKFGPPTRTDYRIVVENLSSRVSWQDLKDLMRQAGEVTYADAHRERKNEGVVEFASYSEMKRALDKLDNSELQGRRIKLIEDKSAKSRRRRSRSRSRSPRSRSRSDSKSKSRSAKRAAKSESRSRSASPVNNGGRDKDSDVE